MILDQHGPRFTLRVPRGEADVAVLVREHGLDFSASASTSAEAILWTTEPHAAVTFIEHATPAARATLAPLHAEITRSWAPEGRGHYRVPADRELWPFQRASLDYALSRQHALVGDEPGLGKTPIAITYANERGARRVLVLCPANIRLQWVRRIYEWSTMQWPFTVHSVLGARQGIHPAAEWTVISYDLARTPAMGKLLAQGRYDVLILDEAHMLKSMDAQRTHAVFGGGRLGFPALASCAEHVLALTGTPLPNRPREAYTLARGLCWDAIDWLSEDRFRERFNPSELREFTRQDGSTARVIDERTGRLPELHNRLRAHLMVRHLKRDVMPQLQMPAYDLVVVQETHAVKAALAAESLLDIDPEQLAGADATVLGHIAVVRQQMGVALAPQVAEYVAMLLDGGDDKLVVFAWHIEVLNILERLLARFRPLRIDGSTTPLQKQTRVELFGSDPARRVIIGNIQSMGTGTDGLQLVSSHALIAEPSWTPGDNIQAFDRLDRGGQTRQVQGDIFVAPGSIVEKILASALRKGHVLHTVLDNPQRGW